MHNSENDACKFVARDLTKKQEELSFVMVSPHTMVMYGNTIMVMYNSVKAVLVPLHL